jgi:eukaryotic-like serine/threonine-protein kinase
MNPNTFAPVGDAFPLAERIGTAFGGILGFFSVSPTGGLTYRAGAESPPGAGLTWFDRKGNSLGFVGTSGQYTDVAISRGGNQIAVTLQDTQSAAPDIWLLDVKQGVPARITSAPGVDSTPGWSPDDRRLAFTSDRGDVRGTVNAYLQDSSGTGKEEQVLKSARVRDWSSDGQYLVYDDRAESGIWRLWAVPLTGDRKPIAYPHGSFDAAGGQFAPNPPQAPGPPRWIAYTSNEAGQYEVYVQSFPPGRGKFRISNGGGS